MEENAMGADEKKDTEKLTGRKNGAVHCPVITYTAEKFNAESYKNALFKRIRYL